MEHDKGFDANALRLLKARYLRKDASGALKETPGQLFTRVAVHACLPEIFYDKRVFDVNSKQPVNSAEDFNPSATKVNCAIGKYTLNEFHLEAIKRMYDRLNLNKQMKLSWKNILEMIESGDFDVYEKKISEFYSLMANRLFMPNSPAIANFGNTLGMGSACFALDVPDSIEGVMETLKNAAILFKSGGGVGYNFSKLRPEGDLVSSTGSIAPGPVRFMKLFDAMTDVITQGGIRRGANMGILNSNHPDIEKFIAAKENNKGLHNFNLSVLIMPDFWGYYENNQPYPLVNPRDGSVLKYISPRALLDKISYYAWECGEPGVLFFDTANEHNPFYMHLGPATATNPCGEVLLYPNESCNLGSINVWAFVRQDSEGNSYFDWDGLRDAARTCTRFLDNALDVNNFPLKSIEAASLCTRKIGLGVMGVADMLFGLRLPYNTEQGRKFMEKLMQFVAYWSKLESIELAKARGPMPYFGKSFYPDGKLPFKGAELREEWDFDWDKIIDDIKIHGIRNGCTTTIAPTGSISMIAGCSYGMEPVYSLVFEKNVEIGRFYYADAAAEKVLKEEGLLNESLKKILVTSTEISPQDHIRALASFQKWVDSSISKTINFPADASADKICDSYAQAYRLGCKGITIYRDASIKNQVLVAHKAEKVLVFTNGGSDEPMAKNEINVNKPAVKPAIKNCPECGAKIEIKQGCLHCPGCDWGMCM